MITANEAYYAMKRSVSNIRFKMAMWRMGKKIRHAIRKRKNAVVIYRVCALSWRAEQKLFLARRVAISLRAYGFRVTERTTEEVISIIPTLLCFQRYAVTYFLAEW